MHNFSKLSWDMRKFSFHYSEAFWPAHKLSHHELVCPCRIQNLGEFLLPFSLEDFEMVDEIILWLVQTFNKTMGFGYISCFYMWKSKLYRKSVNLAVSIIVRRVFMPLWNLSDRVYITFKSVALWKLSDIEIVTNYSI